MAGGSCPIIFFKIRTNFHAIRWRTRVYEIKRRGSTLQEVEKRVVDIFGTEKDVIYSEGRRWIQVGTRSLLCYWAVREWIQ